ncbi:hypothetical protein G9A89_013756 [Geosiphon pyriformis]|nr:hypothetical protein G9A89_013756 [Geosiphon pyriformis]
MAAVKVGTKNAFKNAVSLKGSAKIIIEFFECGINSIFFQRGLYSAEDFLMVPKYGLNVLMTTNDSVKSYLKKILTQVEAWLLDQKISKLVLAIVSQDTRETLERWEFDVEIVAKQNGKENTENVGGKKEKSEKEIKQDIQAIIRQITASVTFLPTLEEECTFNVLVYTDREVEVPTDWNDCDPHLIKNPEFVRLRPFSTNYHKVDSMVAYRLNDDI